MCYGWPPAPRADVRARSAAGARGGLGAAELMLGRELVDAVGEQLADSGANLKRLAPARTSTAPARQTANASAPQGRMLVLQSRTLDRLRIEPGHAALDVGAEPRERLVDRRLVLGAEPDRRTRGRPASVPRRRPRRARPTGPGGRRAAGPARARGTTRACGARSAAGCRGRAARRAHAPARRRRRSRGRPTRAPRRCGARRRPPARRSSKT